MMHPDRPFTTAQARSHGLTDRVLAGPRFRRLFHGVHVAAGVTLELLTVQREAQAQEAGAGSGKESATECINDISDDARRAAIRDVS